MTITMEKSTMKLSKTTLSILKNFSSLNSNLLIKQGNKISTITPAKNVIGEATVEEDFPVEFGIWDLNKFLGTISLFDNPKFTFHDKFVDIEGDNGGTVHFYYSEPSLLTTLKKEINMPEVVIDFDLSEDNFGEIMKASSVLQLSDLCIRSNDDEGTIELVVLDKKSSTTNSYIVSLGENETNDSFEFYYRVENLKLFKGNYSVSICKTVVSKFVHEDLGLQYYIALESDSKYEEG